MNNDNIIIYNSSTDQFVIFDSSNAILVNTFDSIDFSNLPSNVFSNIELYFGNDYKSYIINYQNFIYALINDDIIYNELCNWYEYKGNSYTIYSYDKIEKKLIIDFFNLDLTESNHKLKEEIILVLCEFILSKHYNWKIVRVISF